MLIFPLFVLGLVFGSFLTAFVDRLHDGRDWVAGRSTCDSCGRTLEPIDLIPLVSWLMQRGKCRKCGHPISINYPLTELTMAAVFVFSYVYWPSELLGFESARFVYWLIVAVAFMALIISDLKWMLLPNKIVIPLIGFVISFTAVEAIFYGGGADLVRDAVLGLLVGGGIFYGLFQASAGRWIGGGDVKLGFALGVVVGGPFEALFMIMLASMIGLTISLPLLLFKKVGPKAQLPFGPFLIIAASIMFFFGSQLLDWYTTEFINFSFMLMLN